jgi:GT2 family glycosyltransferase
VTSESVPFVRVVVLTFDGGDMTLACLQSLNDLDWPRDRLEVVLVDNGSLDDVAERTRAQFPDVIVIEPLENLGFAGGCNLGILHGVTGSLADHYDYVALLNNDATVDTQWLKELVNAAESSAEIGGVASKMLFADRYAPVRISIEEELGERRRDELGLCVTALRVDGQRCDNIVQFDEGFHGAVDPDRARNEEIARWSRRTATLRFALIDGEEVTASIRLNSKRRLSVRLESDIDAIDVVVGASGETEYETVDVRLGGYREDVINNVGSELYEFGFAGDRGFMEPDQGQYDEPCEVFAWCGGATLLRAKHLDEVGTFDTRLFLYYEDTDLSWRGRKAGWRHMYCPTAIVRHHHAQSSGVGSSVFRYHTERNRLLVSARNAPLRVTALALAGEIRHCVRVNLALLVKRPLTLRMPSKPEPAHRRRVLGAILRRLPGAFASRRSDTTIISKSHIHEVWERRKW